MSRGAGRPARPETIDPELLEATRKALTQLGRDLAVPKGRYTDPMTGRQRTRPKPLELAVLAIQAQEALEVLAAQEVAFARDHDGTTWEQVGHAFDITMQAAHHRFVDKAKRTQPSSTSSDAVSVAR
jgi:hypothetical protein